MSSDNVSVPHDRLPAARRLSLTRDIGALATGRGSGSRGAGGTTDSCISDALANANAANIGKAIIAPRGLTKGARCGRGVKRLSSPSTAAIDWRRLTGI